MGTFNCIDTCTIVLYAIISIVLTRWLHLGNLTTAIVAIDETFKVRGPALISSERFLVDLVELVLLRI